GALLNGSIEKFAEAEQRPFEPGAFAGYLAATPAEQSAFRTMIELRMLLDQLKSLGMNDLQYRAAVRRLLTPLCGELDGLTPDELAETLGLIDTQVVQETG